MRGDLKPAKEAKPKKAQAEKSAKAAAKKKGAKKSKSKKGKVAKIASVASYGCGAFGQEFPTQKKAVAHALTHTAAYPTTGSRPRRVASAACSRCSQDH